MRTALHGMFDGVCSIWGTVPFRDENGISRQREVLDAADVPCHLSFISAGAAKNDGKGSKVQVVARLFLPPELTVNPGSKVYVRQQGRDYCLVCSSQALGYCWHQEIDMCRPDDWA